MHPERFEKTSEELMFDGEERFAIYQIDHGSKARNICLWEWIL